MTSVRIEDNREQRWEQTLEALEDIRMGTVIDGDQVHAWLESWGIEPQKPAFEK